MEAFWTRLLSVQFSAEGPIHPGTGEGDKHQWWWGRKKQRGKSSVEGSAPSDAEKVIWREATSRAREEGKGPPWPIFIHVPARDDRLMVRCANAGLCSMGREILGLSGVLWAPSEVERNRTMHTATLSTRFPAHLWDWLWCQGEKKQFWMQLIKYYIMKSLPYCGILTLLGNFKKSRHLRIWKWNRSKQLSPHAVQSSVVKSTGCLLFHSKHSFITSFQWNLKAGKHITQPLKRMK